MSQADAAFYGDVIAARIESPELVGGGQAEGAPRLRIAGPPTIFTVAVREVYKGTVTERQEVVTSLDGASCGAGLVIDDSFVIYARRVAGAPDTAPLSTSLCDGTYAPDGVNSFPLRSGVEPQPGGHASPTIPPGEVTHGTSGAVSPVEFVGLGFLSAALAATAMTIARRT